MTDEKKAGIIKLNEENYGDWSTYDDRSSVGQKALRDIVNGEKERLLGSDNSTAVKNFVWKQVEAHT